MSTSGNTTLSQAAQICGVYNGTDFLGWRGRMENHIRASGAGWALRDSRVYMRSQISDYAERNKWETTNDTALGKIREAISYDQAQYILTESTAIDALAVLSTNAGARGISTAINELKTALNTQIPADMDPNPSIAKIVSSLDRYQHLGGSVSNELAGAILFSKIPAGYEAAKHAINQSAPTLNLLTPTDVVTRIRSDWELCSASQKKKKAPQVKEEQANKASSGTKQYNGQSSSDGKKKRPSKKERKEHQAQQQQQQQQKPAAANAASSSTPASAAPPPAPQSAAPAAANYSATFTTPAPIYHVAHVASGPSGPSYSPPVYSAPTPNPRKRSHQPATAYQGRSSAPAPPHGTAGALKRQRDQGLAPTFEGTRAELPTFAGETPLIERLSMGPSASPPLLARIEPVEEPSRKPSVTPPHASDFDHSLSGSGPLKRTRFSDYKKRQKLGDRLAGGGSYVDDSATGHKGWLNTEAYAEYQQQKEDLRRSMAPTPVQVAEYGYEDDIEEFEGMSLKEPSEQGGERAVSLDCELVWCATSFLDASDNVSGAKSFTGEPYVVGSYSSYISENVMNGQCVHSSTQWCDICIDKALVVRDTDREKSLHDKLHARYPIGWVLDSGASTHFMFELSDFSEYEELPEEEKFTVSTSSGSIRCEGSGTVVLHHEDT
ncbi:hypothetical protein CONPUDRAFT_157274 [Coniophora puteana RWD-64-598 SS2]|uniref:Retrovirus-related Pol polyprotein from transposon TNT 1-94-like beta-barrel domain-containing protein n=1 Tax=Coniophora puteana (strain RWD-64-598) TaxID=741705 RepID=A0A5M3MDP5_CONPW|nr:uncharacterized protein CONPUDRAFT_157274 [Coniophora puteana RWD-64-598 SS2]EIW77000.1 hypothetical protein CONPUDRAFT_157274 [Coniophora puteana RWD-64-598 SS2]